MFLSLDQLILSEVLSNMELLLKFYFEKMFLKIKKN